MKWNIKKPNLLKVTAYKNRLGISAIMAKILLNRGIALDTAHKEFNDPLVLIEDPYKMVGAEAAADSIIAQCGQDKNFIVFADYDVDGLTSGFIMTDFLQSIGEHADVYYPERSEGYGLSLDFAKIVSEDKDTVVVTVDNGISALAPIEYLQSKDIPVIVTDHHEPQTTLPNCVFCDPWTDKDSAGKHLCGAGVAWKVCMIVEDKLGKGNVENYLPYVALGTVADVMPMNHENIALVNLGVEAINAGKSRTISALMELLDIKTLVPEDIGWKIGPKLNACGRMGSIMTAGELFFMENEDIVDIKDQVRDIIELDDERSKQTKKAQRAIEKLDFNDTLVCVFDASDYPAGIAGIVAGKLAERFNKPAIVYTSTGDNICLASARSVPGLGLCELLDNEVRKGNIDSWGGHAEACGVKLYADRIEDFAKSMTQQIQEMMANGTIEVKESTLDIDVEITFSELNKRLLDEITSLPYDKQVCTEPIVCLRNVSVTAKQPYSNKDHLVLECKDKKGAKSTLVLWGGYPAYAALGEPDTIDIAGKIGTVGFPDRTTKRRASDVTIKIQDMKKAS